MPERLVAHQRQDDLAADARQRDRGRIAPRVERGIGDDDRVVLADHDGQDVVAVERPYRQIDAVRSCCRVARAARITPASRSTSEIIARS